MTGKSHRTIGNLRVFTGTQDLKKNRAEILAFANEKDLGRVEFVEETASGRTAWRVNRHSTVTHYQRPNMTHPQEGGTGGEVSEILFFSAKSKRHPSLIYSMQIIPVCLSIVARRKGVSATRRGGLNWTPISLLVGHPCKLFHIFVLTTPMILSWRSCRFEPLRAFRVALKNAHLAPDRSVD